MPKLISHLFTPLPFKREKRVICVSMHQSLPLWKALWFLCSEYRPSHCTHNSCFYCLSCVSCICIIGRSNTQGRYYAFLTFFQQDLPVQIRRIQVVAMWRDSLSQTNTLGQVFDFLFLCSCASRSLLLQLLLSASSNSFPHLFQCIKWIKWFMWLQQLY